MEEAQVAQQINPLLDRVRMPGETFPLPSGGIFYKHGELDSSVENAEIHIYPMTAFDEILMKTPDKLFSGDAVREVFSRCVPQVLRPEELLSKDVDYILTCLRKISYGPEMRIEYQHNCEGAKRHTYTVDVSDFIRSARKIDPAAITKEWKVTTSTDQVVTLQPVRFKDFVSLMQTWNTSKNDEDLSPENLRDMMVESISGLIVDVDGVVEHKFIVEWLKQLRAGDIRKIHERIEKTTEWGPNFHSEITCIDCGARVKYEAPLNPLSFFT